MATDEHALLLQISFDLARLQKQSANAEGIVDKGLTGMEKRAKKAAQNIEESLSLKGVNPGVPYMLSGGLDADNVAEALGITNAPGVDVSSGVERAPGVKDPAKIRAFIRAARAANVLTLSAANVVKSA